MPDIKQVEREKGLLKAIFEFCGIENLDFEARHLEENFLIRSQAAWDEAITKKDKNQIIPIANFFSNEQVLDEPLRNYLYLTAHRTLLASEWEKAQINLMNVLGSAQFAESFKSGIRVYVEGKPIDVKAPDVREDDADMRWWLNYLNKTLRAWPKTIYENNLT